MEQLHCGTFTCQRAFLNDRVYLKVPFLPYKELRKGQSLKRNGVTGKVNLGPSCLEWCIIAHSFVH